MRKLLVLIGLLLVSWPVLTAQPQTENSERFERIRRAREAFLTEQLDLTAAEQEGFFPLFWRYQREMNALRRERHRARRDGMEEDTYGTLTETEARQLLEEQFAAEKKVLELKRRAAGEFLKVLPATKLIRLERAERAFREQLVDRVRGVRERNLRPARNDKGRRF